MPSPMDQTTPLAGVKGKTRLLPQVREAIRLRHYSPRTEDTYVWWTRAFVHHCGLRHPAEVGGR
ncbi:MAG: phage integrase N-terminal SAM-like domain-containing protein, partial [Gemmatimonadaceae bacterium]